MAHLLVHRPAPDAPRNRGAVGAGLYLHLERFLLGHRADPRRRQPADHGRPVLAQRPVDRAMAPRLGRVDPCRPAAGADVLPDAKAFHRGPHPGCRQMNWRIDAGDQTIALTTTGGIPVVTYWGPRLPLAEDLGQLALSAQNDLTGGMLDALAPVTLTPESGRAFAGQPGLVVQAQDGTPLHPQFTFDRAEQSPAGLVFHSRATGMQLAHHLTAQPTGVITLQTVLTADHPVRVQWLAAPVLPAPQHGDIIDVHGKWIREFHLNRTPWSAGIRMRESRTGRSGHEHPPHVLCVDT
eukprot:Opistho-1_new@31574